MVFSEYTESNSSDNQEYISDLFEPYPDPENLLLPSSNEDSDESNSTCKSEIPDFYVKQERNRMEEEKFKKERRLYNKANRDQMQNTFSKIPNIKQEVKEEIKEEPESQRMEVDEFTPIRELKEEIEENDKKSEEQLFDIDSFLIEQELGLLSEGVVKKVFEQIEDKREEILRPFFMDRI